MFEEEFLLALELLREYHADISSGNLDPESARDVEEFLKKWANA